MCGEKVEVLKDGGGITMGGRVLGFKVWLRGLGFKYQPREPTSHRTSRSDLIPTVYRSQRDIYCRHSGH